MVNLLDSLLQVSLKSLTEYTTLLFVRRKLNNLFLMFSLINVLTRV